MASIENQTKLSNYIPKEELRTPRQPDHLIDWDHTRPELKRFILLHLLRAVEEYQGHPRKFTPRRLVNMLSRNMGGVVKAQIQIYVDNLIYYGLIQQTKPQKLTITEKVYDELRDIDKRLTKKDYWNKEAHL